MLEVRVREGGGESVEEIPFDVRARDPARRRARWRGASSSRTIGSRPCGGARRCCGRRRQRRERAARAALVRLQPSLGYRFADRELLRAGAAPPLGRARTGRAFVRAARVPGRRRALPCGGGPPASRAGRTASEGELTRARAALVREGSLAALARAPRAAGGARGRERPEVRPRAGRPCSPTRSRPCSGRSCSTAAGARSGRGQPPVRRSSADARPRRSSRSRSPSPRCRSWRRSGACRCRSTARSRPAAPRTGGVYVYEVEFDGRVLARGEGPSKKAAQQEAARRALRSSKPEVEGEAARAYGTFRIRSGHEPAVSRRRLPQRAAGTCAGPSPGMRSWASSCTRRSSSERVA